MIENQIEKQRRQVQKQNRPKGEEFLKSLMDREQKPESESKNDGEVEVITTQILP